MNTLRTTIAVILAAGLASTLLAACAAPAYVSPVEVTRFAAPSAQPGSLLGQGTISLRPAPGMDAEAIEFSLVRAAVAAELERIGYQVVPDMGAQVATISLRQQVDRPERRGPVTVGGNAGLGSWGSGVGLGVGIDLSGQPAERIDRQLSVTIRSADAPANLWEGRARFTATANSQFAETAPAAAHAAAALFAGFPGQSGETVVVE